MYPVPLEFSKEEKTSRISNMFNSLSTALAVSMFADDADSVGAPEMWRDINAKFTGTSGGLKQLAISKLMQFRYQSNKTA